MPRSLSVSPDGKSFGGRFIGLLVALAAASAGAAEPAVRPAAGTPPTPAAATGAQPAMTRNLIPAPTSRPFGRLADGTEARLWTLEVPGGWKATVTDFGAILTSLIVPDRAGGGVDVVLGFDDIAGYEGKHPYFGATCGRVANRVARGTFDLAGRTHSLATNNGPNHLHGGVKGFDKKLWQAVPRATERGPAVEFSVVSPDGDEGYPGRLSATCTYTLSPDGELWVEMEATTDAATIVNMAHHSYWNLAGQSSGSIRGHELVVAADRYLPVDAGGIPTGEFAAVASTPFDFRPERRPAAGLAAAIAALPAAADGTSVGGVDHNFLLRDWKPDGALRPAAILRDPESGRSLEILTDQPGIQVYTGNYLDGTLAGKGGKAYPKQAAICLETQKYPDSIHHEGQPGWPSVRLDPGSTYRHTMVHRFHR